MSNSRSSKVYLFDNDPPMQRASRKAQRAFRYFWREVACDHRRTVPALSMAIVKAPFSDAKPPATKTKHGMTAKELAQALGWKNVAKLFERT